MHNLRNLTNSPHSIRLADGAITLLPARGSLDNLELHPSSLLQIKACGYIELTETLPDVDGSEVGGEVTNERRQENESDIVSSGTKPRAPAKQRRSKK